MADIVLGIATSHGPMLVTAPEQWEARVAADTRRPLQARAAAHHSDRYFLLFSGITPNCVGRLR